MLPEDYHDIILIDSWRFVFLVMCFEKYIYIILKMKRAGKTKSFFLYIIFLIV